MVALVVFIRRSAGRSGATKVQIAERRAGRNVILEHIGTAHDEAELAVLMQIARERIRPGQEALDLGLDDAPAGTGRARGVITSKRCALLWDVLTSAYARLGFDVLGDDAFMQLVLARLVEPTSKADSVRVLEEIGVPHVDVRTFFRALDRAVHRDYRGQIAADIVVMAVRSGCQVHAVVAPTVTEVLGVNDKVQLAEVEAVHRRRRAQELMLQGVTLVDPARFDARGPVTAGRDVHIDVNVVFEGSVRLGDRVHIGPNVVIRDCELGDDVVVHANCVLDHARVGARSIVGPYARLRPDAVLHEDVHVGNFVEVKKSELKRGAKANHLTYLGDATVGEKVNVGAGTITCNYDGFFKQHTEIGAGAFIGCSTSLVAPVRIGAGAIVGAGSVIARDVPDEALVLTRGPHAEKPEWARQFRERRSAEKAAQQASRKS